MSEDLIARAKAASEGYVVPDAWGEVVEVEEGGEFVGRYRGQDTGGRGEPIYLFWDEDDELRFFWNAYRLKQGMERALEQGMTLGDTVCIYRGENYETRYDDEGEASGYSYGVAVEPNTTPPPETASAADQPATDDDIPY